MTSVVKVVEPKSHLNPLHSAPVINLLPFATVTDKGHVLLVRQPICLATFLSNKLCVDQQSIRIFRVCLPTVPITLIV